MPRKPAATRGDRRGLSRQCAGSGRSTPLSTHSRHPIGFRADSRTSQQRLATVTLIARRERLAGPARPTNSISAPIGSASAAATAPTLAPSRRRCVRCAGSRWGRRRSTRMKAGAWQSASCTAIPISPRIASAHIRPRTTACSARARVFVAMHLLSSPVKTASSRTRWSRATSPRSAVRARLPTACSRTQTHGLSSEPWKQAYTQILTGWLTEMTAPPATEASRVGAELEARAPKET
jgi:hypothetical protein